MSCIEKEIFSGTNRGIINIWDMETAKGNSEATQLILYCVDIQLLSIVSECTPKSHPNWPVEVMTLLLSCGIFDKKIALLL